MDTQEFLRQYAQDTNKHTKMDIIYNEFVRYCRQNDITEEDISTEELEDITHYVLQNGMP